MKRLRQPAAIIAIGLIVTIIACLVVGIRVRPTIAEHEFDYSVTYKLNGETKTFDGTYKCVFTGYGHGLSRIYTGEYSDYGLADYSQSFTIEQKDGMDLTIVTSFDDSYLMGDTRNEFYDETPEDPYFIVYDAEGYSYDSEEMVGLFDAEIISWEYPEPLQNTFVFAGFSDIYDVSMIFMVLCGALTLIACVIFVKKDKDVTYKVLDKIGVVLNFAVAIVVFPLLSVASLFIQAFPVGPDWIYQCFYCVPPVIIFSLAASVSLRRKGYSKSGFFIQFIGIVFEVVLAFFEYIL